MRSKQEFEAIVDERDKLWEERIVPRNDRIQTLQNELCDLIKEDAVDMAEYARLNGEIAKGWA